jgi:hypothetical protein
VCCESFGVGSVRADGDCDGASGHGDRGTFGCAGDGHRSAGDRDCSVAAWLIAAAWERRGGFGVGGAGCQGPGSEDWL